jgi:shikimate dehydrogenase
MTKDLNPVNIKLNVTTKFIISTSGLQSSLERHNKALKRLELDLVYFTFPHDVTPEIYAGLLRAPLVLGGAVTGKHGLKSTIIPFLDDVEPIAREALAVNTVVNKKGKLYGYNTDSFGLKTALTKGIEESKIRIKKAVIYGNGGVSGVAYKVLESMGMKVAMVGRNKERVLKKKKELGINHIPHFEGPYDLVVDATPVSADPGFIKNAISFSDLLKDCKIVFCHNMPELSGKKNYLKEYCSQNNKFFIPGKLMYDAQLIKQFKLILEGLKKQDNTSITEKDIIEAWQI